MSMAWFGSDNHTLPHHLLEGLCCASQQRLAAHVRIGSFASSPHAHDVRSCPKPDVRPRSAKCQYRKSRTHSALMPAALMMGHHFSMSAFCNAPRASGVCWSRDGISCSMLSNRRRTVGSARASTTAALSLWITSFGVLLGAKSPYQTDW